MTNLAKDQIIRTGRELVWFPARMANVLNEQKREQVVAQVEVCMTGFEVSTEEPGDHSTTRNGCVIRESPTSADATTATM